MVLLIAMCVVVVVVVVMVLVVKGLQLLLLENGYVLEAQHLSERLQRTSATGWTPVAPALAGSLWRHSLIAGRSSCPSPSRPCCPGSSPGCAPPPPSWPWRPAAPPTAQKASRWSYVSCSHNNNNSIIISIIDSNGVSNVY